MAVHCCAIVLLAAIGITSAQVSFEFDVDNLMLSNFTTDQMGTLLTLLNTDVASAIGVGTADLESPALFDDTTRRLEEVTVETSFEDTAGVESARRLSAAIKYSSQVESTLTRNANSVRPALTDATWQSALVTKLEAEGFPKERPLLNSSISNVVVTDVSETAVETAVFTTVPVIKAVTVAHFTTTTTDGGGWPWWAWVLLICTPLCCLLCLFGEGIAGWFGWKEWNKQKTTAEVAQPHLQTVPTTMTVRAPSMVPAQPMYTTMPPQSYSMSSVRPVSAPMATANFATGNYATGVV